MAAPVIEAKSLSSLTALAANPPSYPRNPTHERHEPLVLYIARVPGSKDVFLSPMKPRDKVVTAEDIQSSLYFVHFSQPEDVHLLDSSDSRQSDLDYEQQPSVNRHSMPVVQRKAVPTRKPMSATLAPINDHGNRQNINAGNYLQRPGALAPDYNPRRSFDSTQYRQENQRPAASPRRQSENPPRPGPSLTLIRRDPSSGAQWNVARIEDPPALDVSSSNLDTPIARRKTGAPMYIEVYNPGYSKFLHADASVKPPLVSRDSGFSIQSDEVDAYEAAKPQMEPQPTASDNIFRRRMWMEGSHHVGGNFGHRKNSSYDYNNPQSDSSGSYGGQSNQFASQPPASFLAHKDQTYSSIQVSDRLTSFRGYVFTSPWNGRCEFVTGVGGGSLKCRHVIPGLQGAPPTAMTVSELRFNLPSGPKGTTPKGEESSKRSSFFRRGRHSRNNLSLTLGRDDGTEDSRDALDRLDLSLGQEFAGGGFGGKQAKLGKIILEDEGLKMIDLLVAANLGLWWRAYEKASGGS